MMRVLPGARRHWRAGLLPVLLLVSLVGCSPQLTKGKAKTVKPSAGQAPVALQNLRVDTVDGHRAVFLHLSRVPTAVRNSSSSNPARITVRVWGPNGEDLPAKVLPEIDPQISKVRISRQQGILRIELDMKGTTPPPYSVHEMADWIMIRLPASQVPQQG